LSESWAYGCHATMTRLSPYVVLARLSSACDASVQFPQPVSLTSSARTRRLVGWTGTTGASEQLSTSVANARAAASGTVLQVMKVILEAGTSTVKSGHLIVYLHMLFRDIPAERAGDILLD